MYRCQWLFPYAKNLIFLDEKRVSENEILYDLLVLYAEAILSYPSLLAKKVLLKLCSPRYVELEMLEYPSLGIQEMNCIII